MKRVLISLLLLCSVALACDANVARAENNFASGSYSDEIRLAEVYYNTAVCFQEEGKGEKADFYFTHAGNYYVSSAQKLSQDTNLRASLFASAGEAYARADLIPLAKANFNRVFSLNENYPRQVSEEVVGRAQRGLNVLEVNELMQKPKEKPSALTGLFSFNTGLGFVQNILPALLLLGLLAVAIVVLTVFVARR